MLVLVSFPHYCSGANLGSGIHEHTDTRKMFKYVCPYAVFERGEGEGGRGEGGGSTEADL